MRTPREITKATIAEIADRYGVTPDELVSHRHPKRLLAARMELAKALEARGYNGVQIGRAMGRDYTTAYFYLGRTGKVPSPRSIVPPPAAVAPPQPRRRRPKLVPYAGRDPAGKSGNFASNRPQPGSVSTSQPNPKTG